jgi:peptide deformylase
MAEHHNHNHEGEHRTLVQGKPVESYPDRAPEAARGKALRVTEVGEEILHRPLKEVAEFGTLELNALIDDMFTTMYVADGVGLAANQVDVDLRVFVYDCPDDDGDRHVGHICNPVLDDLGTAGRTLDEAQEGCLSVPGAYEDLARPHRAVVRGFDKDGEPMVLEGTGYFARCLQHETDHLNGYLYIDRLSKRDRKSAMKQMEAERERVVAKREAKAEALGK